MLYFYFLGLFLLSAVLTYAYISYARHRNWLDIPNQRSSHVTKIPRGGGLIFISLWLLIVLLAFISNFLPWKQMLGLLLGGVIVAAVGFYDDRKSLSARTRAGAYFLAAMISILAMGGWQSLILAKNLYLPLSWFGWILAALMIVWSINLFNFMDGIDGISGVEAIFVLGVGGMLLCLGGGYPLAILSFLLVALVAGFLVWNFPPAKLFMGDVGSATLGFIIMSLAFIGEKEYQVPVMLWLILYGVFFFDATLTLLRRFLAKERWYEAHCLHAYQRLYQAGWTHRQVVYGVICVNIVLSVIALIGFYWRNLIIPGFLLAYFILLLAYLWVEKRKPMYDA